MAKTATIFRLDVAAVVDELGLLKAQIAALKKLEPSRQLVTAHTSVGEFVTVRVVARKS